MNRDWASHKAWVAHEPHGPFSMAILARHWQAVAKVKPTLSYTDHHLLRRQRPAFFRSKLHTGCWGQSPLQAPHRSTELDRHLKRLHRIQRGTKGRVQSRSDPVEAQRIEAYRRRKAYHRMRRRLEWQHTLDGNKRKVTASKPSWLPSHLSSQVLHDQQKLISTMIAGAASASARTQSVAGTLASVAERSEE